MEKSSFQIKFILEIFFTHCDKNGFQNKNIMPNFALVPLLSETLKKRRLQKVGTLFEKQT